MKKIFFLILLLFLDEQNYAQYEYKYLDSILVSIQPDSIKQTDNNQFIQFRIRNKCTQTLITIEEVVIAGLTEGIYIWPRPYQNSVDFLSLRSKDYAIDYGDGRVFVIYNHLPKFLIIEPGKIKVIKVSLSPYWNVVKTSNWRVGGDIFLALKDILDLKIKYDFPNDMENYNNHIDYADTITIIPKTLEALREENKIEDDTKQSYEKLNDIFIISTGFDKNK
jgi:hypothetical protein